jgi:hypothetical protein
MKTLSKIPKVKPTNEGTVHPEELTNCECCGDLMYWNPQTCCDGWMCGCQGMTIYPSICSKDCWVKMTKYENGKRKGV